MKVHYKDRNGQNDWLSFEDVHGDQNSLKKIEQNMSEFLSSHQTSYQSFGLGYGELKVDNQTLHVTPYGLPLQAMISFLSENFGFSPESEDLGVMGGGGDVGVQE